MIRITSSLLIILLLGICLAAPAMAAPINLSESGQSRLFEQENSAIIEANTSYNSTLLHHIYYHAPFEIPPWFWMFFFVGGMLFLLFAWLWTGNISVSFLTSLLSVFMLGIAQFTVFAIREWTFHAGFLIGTADQIGNFTISSAVQPIVVVWDWAIPFLTVVPFFAIAIATFIVTALDLGRPGLRYLFPRKEPNPNMPQQQGDKRL